MRHVAALLLLPLVNPAMALECVVDKAVICADSGCEAAPSAMRINVDDEKRAVFRCDAKGCDEISVERALSGAMINYVSAANAYVLRYNTMNDKFVEVTAMMTSAYIKHGKCTRRGT